MRSLLALFLLTASLYPTDASAQVALRTYLGDQDEDRFGIDVARIGDLNGDGVEDYAIGATRDELTPTSPEGGVVRLYSGSDGSWIREIAGGPDDLFGSSIVGLGDLDGDGIPDLAVGALAGDGAGLIDCGYVSAFSGASGATLWQAFGDGPNAYLGTSVGSPGDVDGDGVQDVLAGAPGSAMGGLSQAGMARLYSGVDGTPLMTIAGEEQGEWLGFSVASAGDVNGDGIGTS